MSETFKCPSCGAILEKGYIQAPRGLYWDNKKHDWQTFTSTALIDSLETFTLANREAYRCQNCKIVVIKY